MEYNAALNGVVAQIENRNDGRPYIVLNGRSPIQDSFIDLILEAQWSTGRAVKNYALLLNSASPASSNRQTAWNAPAPIQQEVIASPIALPRTTTTSASNDASLTPSSIDINANQVPVYRFDPVDTAAASATAAAPSTFALSAVPTSTYTGRNESYSTGGNPLTVRTGDTASELLMGRLPANVSLDQMLLAMVRANPTAFIEGNVNLVRAGSVLRMPKPGEATLISRAEARQTVIAQNRDFATYARRVAESPLLVGSTQSREMSGTVTTEAQNTVPPSAKQDKLKLSKAQVGDNRAEAKLAAEREAKDAADQLSALNKNMRDLEALALGVNTPSLPATVNDEPSLMAQLSQNRSIWAWVVGAVLALLALVFWSYKKSSRSSEVFAPSYDDGPSQSMPDSSAMNIPPQMAGIDLNLNSSPAPGAIHEVTEQNKLALASQLLASGDKDLARTLIMSVASTASGDLKARALQMLGQIA
jgi:pilus assembly protein FimV